MKKLLLSVFTLMAFCLLSCETEPVGVDALDNVAGKGKNKAKKKPESNTPKIIKECMVIDVDRCPAGDLQPSMNLWWPVDGNDFYNLPDYFNSTESNKLKFVKYDNGTAHITGSTSMGVGSCIVEVDVWLKDLRNWEEWSSVGGGHKKEGCAGDASNSEDMSFYVIDSELSTITASGGDCLGEGVFGLEQRPDPNDDNTPNYGVHVGPGGANYDSEIGAYGLSTWGWILDADTKERLWVMDFNFKLDCEPTSTGCETAFARTSDGSNCFIDEGFSRWGWTIGPLTDGTDASYDVYSAAGQCDISKGELVGTVDISYVDGEVTVTYNIDDAYTVQETHTYAGNEMFPTMKNGRKTVAPGRYSIEENLTGEVYVIAHAVVCN